MKTAILNTGGGAWAFEAHAQNLSRALEIEISATPADFNYVLGWEGATDPSGQSFIPLVSMRLAADKRLLAEVFAANNVPTPTTYLLQNEAEIERVIASQKQSQWVLKWPTGCGGAGHRLQNAGMRVPADWPRPYVLQEFIRLEKPEVYRVYGIADTLFGWNARRFPRGVASSPFVAHARGARYEDAGEMSSQAEAAARAALEATGLLASFGCADLMQSEIDEWLVLEVNTDGFFGHVDRDIALPGIADEIATRLKTAFWDWAKS